MGIVLLFDWAESFRSVTPPLFSIGLLLFSFLIGSRWMIFWGFVYSLTVAFILLNPTVYAVFSGNLTPPEILSHRFRVLGFCSTAGFACLFSWTLERLRKKRAILDHLILKMPLPMLISGVDGDIQLANDKAQELLGGQVLGNEKGLFFDLLAPKGSQGKCISTYLTIFKEGTDTKQHLDLESGGKPIRGELEIIDSKPRRLVTMLLPVKSDNTSDK